jgi:hypothetical protein
MNDTIAKRILKAIQNELFVKERTNPFKDRRTLRCSGNLILHERELNEFAYAHGMETDLISLIFIVDKEDLAVGKGLIDEHGMIYEITMQISILFGISRWVLRIT